MCSNVITIDYLESKVHVLTLSKFTSMCPTELHKLKKFFIKCKTLILRKSLIK